VLFLELGGTQAAQFKNGTFDFSNKFELNAYLLNLIRQSQTVNCIKFYMHYHSGAYFFMIIEKKSMDNRLFSTSIYIF